MEKLSYTEKELYNFGRLKAGIAWRKEEYKKELDTGRDGDGEKLTEVNRLITLNLYNIMCALESYYTEDVEEGTSNE